MPDYKYLGISYKDRTVLATVHDTAVVISWALFPTQQVDVWLPSREDKCT